MSAAKAACDHMKSLWQGTPEGSWVSMGVFSDGSYNTVEGVMFSFPIQIKNKQWTIVKVGLFFYVFKPRSARRLGLIAFLQLECCRNCAQWSNI